MIAWSLFDTSTVHQESSFTFKNFPMENIFDLVTCPEQCLVFQTYVIIHVSSLLIQRPCGRAIANVYGIETERLVRNCVMTGVFVYLRIWNCFYTYSNTEAYLVFNGNAIRTLPCVHALSTSVDCVWSAWWWKQGQHAIYMYMNVYSYSSIKSDQYFLFYHCSMNSV